MKQVREDQHFDLQCASLHTWLQEVMSSKWKVVRRQSLHGEDSCYWVHVHLFWEGLKCMTFTHSVADGQINKKLRQFVGETKLDGAIEYTHVHSCLCDLLKDQPLNCRIMFWCFSRASCRIFSAGSIFHRHSVPTGLVWCLLVGHTDKQE